MTQQALALSQEQLAEFCARWKISELALFGSALRDDFRPGSDIDVLVSFTDDANWGLLDHIQMEQELEELVGREVDLVSKCAVRGSTNWLRRRAILDTAEVLFAARLVTTHPSFPRRRESTPRRPGFPPSRE